ncbi:MAG: SEL1-like repeat protein [Polyangiaceae bacterium]|nr:SEL1-like repeat protein [Polyangiaceae bacterium]
MSASDSRAGAKILEVGMHVDRYELVRPIGRGAMGEVWRARHRYTQANCAIKTLHPQLVTSQRVADLFVQEAHVGARLAQHPNIVRVQDAGHDTEAGLPFLVMELLEGETLEERRRREGPLPWELGRVLFEQLGDAVQSAHDAQVIHRDLKPGNLFLTRDRKGAPLLKVLDFGIARVLEEDASRTATQVGTPAYAAPEQLGPTYRTMAERQGVTIARQVSPATDIWALGLVAYDLLTGAEPGTFWGVQTSAELPVRIALDDAPRPSSPAAEIGISLPQGFDEWFAHCAARDARERFATFDEAARALVTLLGGPASVDTARTQGVLVSAGPTTSLSGPRTVETRFEVATMVPSNETDKAPSAAATLRSETTKRPGDTAPGSSERALPAATEALIASYCPGALSGAASTTGGTTASVATSATVRPRRRLIAGGASLMVVLVMAGVGTSWYRQRAEDAAARAAAAAARTAAQAQSAREAAAAQENAERLEAERLSHAARQLPGEPVDRALLQEAQPAFRLACDKGNVDGCAGLAYSKLYGIGVAADGKAALAELDRACQHGSAEACAASGELRTHGLYGVSKDPALAKTALDRAVSLFQEQCNGNQPAACAALGYFNAMGLGVAKNAGRAAELFRKACDGGAAAGCARLGHAYRLGEGVPKKTKDAVELLQKACDADNARGCAELGSMLAKGQGIARDTERAAELAKKGCDADVMLGCSVLGDAYFSGRGMTKSAARAAELYEKACQSPVDPVWTACVSLGNLYETGQGVKQNVNKSAKLWDRACQGGIRTACADVRYGSDGKGEEMMPPPWVERPTSNATSSGVASYRPSKPSAQNAPVSKKAQATSKSRDLNYGM